MAQEPPLVFLRDLSDVEPPRDRYTHYDEEDIYRLVPRPQWTGLEDEIWTPRANENDPQLERVKGAHAARAAPPPSRRPPRSRPPLLGRSPHQAEQLRRGRRRSCHDIEGGGGRGVHDEGRPYAAAWAQGVDE